MFPPLRHRALAALRAFVLLEDPELEARVAAGEASPAAAAGDRSVPSAPGVGADGTAGRRAAALAHRAPLAAGRAPRLRRREGAVPAGPAHCTSPVGPAAQHRSGRRAPTT